MAASPELRRPPSSPAEFKLGPFTALPLAEDRGSSLSEVEDGAGAGVCRTPISKGGGGACALTPTSIGSKIPPITSCPPAPRKTGRMEAAASCKRRLSELELFRVGPELMELLFRPLVPRQVACLPASPAAKRRRGRCQDYE